MVELDPLWSMANEALAKACALPWGPERIEALKAAGRLRNEAANKAVGTVEFRTDNRPRRARSVVSFKKNSLENL